MLKVFLFDIEHRRRVSCLDQPSSNGIGVFEGGIVLHFNDVVGPKFGGESCVDKYGLCRFTIARSNRQPSPSVAFESNSTVSARLGLAGV